MVSPRQNQHLLFFTVSGERFAARADQVANITDASWRPQPSPNHPEVLLRLSNLLALPNTTAGRTLVVNTAAGTCGIVVDSITKDDMAERTVHSIPALVRQWLHKPWVEGFSLREGGQGLVSVLDLGAMAHASLDRSNASPEGGSTP